LRAKNIRLGKQEVIMIIAVGSDHGGFNLKQEICEYLKESGYPYKDFGTNSEESVDYPDFALAVAQGVAGGEYGLGILVCGTGIGVSISANKVRGIRAALCHDTFSARMSREHNDANILAMGERVVGRGLALDIVRSFLASSFSGGRHSCRVDKMKTIEDRHLGRS
jgi:ribose 5-phosphate isomerase B